MLAQDVARRHVAGDQLYAAPVGSAVFEEARPSREVPPLLRSDGDTRQPALRFWRVRLSHCNSVAMVRRMLEGVQVKSNLSAVL